ncbi:MAG: cation:proton antiporter, partial [Planctomycetota bacterium]
LEFKENLRVLLISSLFVVLSARLTLGDLQSLDWRAFLFVVVLILVVRPLSVLVSTRGSSLNWNERAFIAWMAPRGIVAAAVASVFALALENTGREDANQIAPVIFSVILGTVAAYGLTATLFARRLGLSDPNPQGLLIVGASPWARAFAQALRKRGIRVVLADSNRENIRAARMEELDTYYGNVLDEYAIEDMDLGGMGRLLAATPNAEVNVLTVHRFLPVFGRAGVYRIPAREPKKSDAAKAAVIGPNTVKPDATGAEPGPADDNTTGPNGRVAFAAHATYANLSQRKGHGHVVKSTTLSDEFTFADYRTLYGSSALMIAVCTPDNLVRLVSPDRPITPEPGDTIIALVDPDALFLA